MFKRFAASTCAAFALIVGVSVLSVTVAGQAATGGSDGQAKSNYKAARTPWGDPDLQGIYESNDNVGVPVERPEKFGTRMYLNDEEFKQRDLQAKKAAEDNKEDRRQLAAEDTGDGP